MNAPMCRVPQQGIAGLLNRVLDQPLGLMSRRLQLSCTGEPKRVQACVWVCAPRRLGVGSFRD